MPLSGSPFSRMRTCQIGKAKIILRCRFYAAPFDNKGDQNVKIPRRNKEPPIKFAFLGCNVEQNWTTMPKSDLEAISEKCFTFISTLLKDGHVITDGVTLQPTCTAKTLRWQNGSVVVTDGPFAETKEQLGGVIVLEARDMEHAVELMSKHPGLHHGAAIEIRPVNEESLRCQAASINAFR